MITETPATGIRGILIYLPFQKGQGEGRYVFRVYDAEDKRKFIDYEMNIDDLQIEIYGNYSSLYLDSETGKGYISYPSRGSSKK